MDEMAKAKQQLVDELVVGTTQLVTKLVAELIPNQVVVDKATALESFTTQELIAEVSRRVG